MLQRIPKEQNLSWCIYNKTADFSRQFLFKINKNRVYTSFSNSTIMNVDPILMIPHLSKELNLIGHPTLPYSLETRQKKGKPVTEHDDKNLKIVFDSKKMTEALISVCFELVKQVKTLGFNVDDNEIDKLNFEKVKLEKQVKMCKADLKKIENELVLEKKSNKKLQEKIEQLEKLVKEKQVELQKSQKKSATNENVLRHKINKNESDLLEMHKVMWKKFNMVDANFFPKNFQIIQNEEPDFNKLWSEVKYSNIRTKEEALKKAVCKFQENNRILMENNFIFKNLFVITLQEINETNKMLHTMLHLPKFASGSTISDVFSEGKELDVTMYKNIVLEHFSSLKRVFELFKEFSFFVSEDLFVCWSDVVEKFKTLDNSLDSTS